MKLLACNLCGDVFNLTREYRECSCKSVSGNYVDRLNAEVFMSKRGNGFVLGFANSSFGSAIWAQHVNGDSEEVMPYMGTTVAKGRDFAAFIIPESAPSVTYHYDND